MTPQPVHQNVLQQCLMIQSSCGMLLEQHCITYIVMTQLQATLLCGLSDKIETTRQELVVELQQAAVTDSASHAQGDCEPGKLYAQAGCMLLYTSAWPGTLLLDLLSTLDMPTLHSCVSQIDSDCVFAGTQVLMHDLPSF